MHDQIRKYNDSNRTLHLFLASCYKEKRSALFELLKDQKHFGYNFTRKFNVSKMSASTTFSFLDIIFEFSYYKKKNE